MTNAPISNPRPWWRFGMVWMVIAGPLLVVIASVYTFMVAARNIDPVLLKDEAVRTSPDISQAPAVEGRNHSATGALPQPGQPAKP
ncbi:MAG: hypothetical protein RIQ97_621 [Pseudomonadota bacterium]|jgi:hypothetical protein